MGNSILSKPNSGITRSAKDTGTKATIAMKITVDLELSGNLTLVTVRNMKITPEIRVSDKATPNSTREVG
jgi:hypothetical protein